MRRKPELIYGDHSLKDKNPFLACQYSLSLLVLFCVASKLDPLSLKLKSNPNAAAVQVLLQIPVKGTFPHGVFTLANKDGSVNKPGASG